MLVPFLVMLFANLGYASGKEDEGFQDILAFIYLSLLALGVWFIGWLFKSHKLAKHIRRLIIAGLIIFHLYPSYTLFISPLPNDEEFINYLQEHRLKLEHNIEERLKRGSYPFSLGYFWEKLRLQEIQIIPEYTHNGKATMYINIYLPQLTEREYSWKYIDKFRSDSFSEMVFSAPFGAGVTMIKMLIYHNPKMVEMQDEIISLKSSTEQIRRQLQPLNGYTNLGYWLESLDSYPSLKNYPRATTKLLDMLNNPKGFFLSEEIRPTKITPRCFYRKIEPEWSIKMCVR